MEKMKELYAKVAGDSALQKKFAEIVNETAEAGEEALQEKLIAFAKEAGYDVSPDELAAFFKDLANKEKDELSEDELDAVAGGKAFPGPTTSAGVVITPCQRTSFGSQFSGGCSIF